MSDPNAPQPPYGQSDPNAGQPPYGQATPPPGSASYPPPQQGGGPGREAADVLSQQGKGFIGALFDFTFTHFITPMIVKVVYILAVGVLGLSWIVFTLTAFTQSALFGLFCLIIGPIIALIYLAFIRMTLEFYLAIVRMSEDVHHRLPR